MGHSARYDYISPYIVTDISPVVQDFTERILVKWRSLERGAPLVIQRFHDMSVSMALVVHFVYKPNCIGRGRVNNIFLVRAGFIPKAAPPSGGQAFHGVVCHAALDILRQVGAVILRHALKHSL